MSLYYAMYAEAAHAHAFLAVPAADAAGAAAGAAAGRTSQTGRSEAALARSVSRKSCVLRVCASVADAAARRASGGSSCAEGGMRGRHWSQQRAGLSLSAEALSAEALSAEAVSATRRTLTRSSREGVR